MEFEDSTILEKLAQHGLVDEFYEAVDSDDPKKIKNLLRSAEVPEDRITLVLLAIGLE